MGWRPGRVPGFFFEKRCHAMTSEAELSLGWADEGVCPYANMSRRGRLPLRARQDLPRRMEPSPVWMLSKPPPPFSFPWMVRVSYLPSTVMGTSSVMWPSPV
jgi:hypothetical protein